jgi:hypothetical protein
MMAYTGFNFLGGKISYYEMAPCVLFFQLGACTCVATGNKNL